jgi:class 3 adenylate cyclase
VAELPSGTVTLLFTDIEGSTQLQRRLGEHWADVHATHRRLLREAVAEADGREVDTQGDALFAVFSRATNGLSAAATAQRSLGAHAWPQEADLRVRMGMHTGEPTVGDEGYLGLDVVRAARICSLACGGQVLVSEATRVLARGEAGDLRLEAVGAHRLKDFDEPEQLFALVAPGLERGPTPAVRPEDAASTALISRAQGLELANRAMAAARDLEGLGDRITREVDEMLAAAGIPPTQPSAKEPDGQPAPSRRWWQRRGRSS